MTTSPDSQTRSPDQATDDRQIATQAFLHSSRPAAAAFVVRRNEETDDSRDHGHDVLPNRPPGFDVLTHHRHQSFRSLLLGAAARSSPQRARSLAPAPLTRPPLPPGSKYNHGQLPFPVKASCEPRGMLSFADTPPLCRGVGTYTEGHVYGPWTGSWWTFGKFIPP